MPRVSFVQWDYHWAVRFVLVLVQRQRGFPVGVLLPITLLAQSLNFLISLALP